MSEFRFQVNLGGMIEILSDHLYSSPDVYIREILQNAVDAIVGRQKKQPDFTQGNIEIILTEGKEITLRDNGLGLTEQEIHQFLAIIGNSSKKDVESGRILNDFIGRFGIGLLSCFMVADQICIRTRSMDMGKSLEWIGNPDGTYTITELEAPIEVGTEVYLKAKEGAEYYFQRETVERLVLHYGILLPVPITLEDGKQKRQLNPTYLPWEGRHTNKEELMAFGRMMFREDFLDCVVLHSQDGQVDGVAYILPYTVQPSSRQRHRIYLKHMLLTEEGENILPDWAVFTKCIINTMDLRPTASREGFYEDRILANARENLGKCISEYLTGLAKSNKEGFSRFLRIHSLAVKSLAIENDDLYRLFIDYLEFQTTRGAMTGQELVMSREPLVYAHSVDKYKQLAQLFFAQGKLLINTGYVYDMDLLSRMPEFFPVEVVPVNESEVDDVLKELSVEDSELAIDFERRANRILKAFGCVAEGKRFLPSNQPTFYFVNESAVLYHELLRAKEKADIMFHDMFQAFSSELQEKKEAILYFNFSNPIVRKLMATEEQNIFEDFVTVLYVQALLVGGFALKNNELGVMNDKILSIMERGLMEE